MRRPTIFHPLKTEAILPQAEEKKENKSSPSKLHSLGIKSQTYRLTADEKVKKKDS